MLNCQVLTEKLLQINQNTYTFGLSYFIGKIHFEEDGRQNYLVFQPMYIYFKRVVGAGTGNYIYAWKSKGLSDEKITPPTTSDYRLNPQLSYYGTKTRVKFDGSCLKQDKVTFNHGKVVNIDIVYEITKVVDSCPARENALVWLKMLISISTNILDIELDLIEDQIFHFRVVDLINM